jgi:predicted RNase H-like HicB family nuclease
MNREAAVLFGVSIKDQAMRFKVILHPNTDGYAIHCPGLAGCWSQGSTELEALDNIASAIKEYFAAIAELTAGVDIREKKYQAAIPELKAGEEIREVEVKYD